MRRPIVLSVTLTAAAALSGLAFASLPLFSPPARIDEFGYVDSVTAKGSGYVLRFDPALWLEGQTANVAAAEDGAIKPGQSVPDDYWIRDPDHRLLTYKLPANAHVTILVNLQTTRISVATLAKLLRTSKPGGRYELRGPGRRGFWLRYSIDTGKALDQQYEP
ncbi:MAG TPA: hypothetical protein VHS03_08710 [Gaiellaceae bacterium]|nr:hypothetical protein [Gaiellaceae bacterium]